MEGLVNYSSDEEHDDYGSQSVDARRSPTLDIKNGNGSLKGVGGVNAANERSNYKNEGSKRDKYNATGLTGRRSDSPHISRENDRSNRSTTHYGGSRIVGRDTNADIPYNNNRTGDKNMRSGSPYNNRDSGRSARADSPYTNRDNIRSARADSPYTNRDNARSARADSPYTNRDNARSARADSPYTNRDNVRSARADSPYINRENVRSARADSPYTNRDNVRSNRVDSPYTSRDRSNRNDSPYAGRDRIHRAVSPQESRDNSRNIRSNSPYGSNNRDGGRDNRYKYDKMNERSRPREYVKNDYHSDQRRSQRADERSFKHQGNYQNERQSNSSRNERNRYGDLSRRNQSHHHDRSPRRDRERSDRFTEQQRRRREDSRSPSPKHRHHRQRSGYNDDKSRYRKRTSRSRSNSASSPRRSASRERAQKSRSTAQNVDRKINSDEGGREKSNANFNRHSEALLSLPLNNNAPKQANIIAVTPTASTSNNGEPAVIQLPSYYNPSVINPNKYAEQVQKRKLIWGAKKSEDTSAKWGNAQFSQDSDGKVASKFMRLMGIKNNAPPTPTAAEVEKKPTEPVDVKSREDMFSSMEKQYEVARQVTHTMRGVGLGFGSQPRPF